MYQRVVVAGAADVCAVRVIQLVRKRIRYKLLNARAAGGHIYRAYRYARLFRKLLCDEKAEGGKRKRRFLIGQLPAPFGADDVRARTAAKLRVGVRIRLRLHEKPVIFTVEFFRYIAGEHETEIQLRVRLAAYHPYVADQDIVKNGLMASVVVYPHRLFIKRRFFRVEAKGESVIGHDGANRLVIKFPVNARSVFIAESEDPDHPVPLQYHVRAERAGDLEFRHLEIGARRA